MDSSPAAAGSRRLDERTPPARGGPARQRARARLRWMILAAMLLVLVQAGIGMVVNLDVTIPASHPGAHPSDYFSGSFHSVVWAIGHGAPALVFHASLGLALVLIVIGVAGRAVRLGRPAAGALSVLAGLLVIGAGFNGASFLDFNQNVSSLIMALLTLGALGCYAAALCLLAA
jgi:hypothetical protein